MAGTKRHLLNAVRQRGAVLTRCGIRLARSRDSWRSMDRTAGPHLGGAIAVSVAPWGATCKVCKRSAINRELAPKRKLSCVYKEPGNEQ